MRILVDQAVSWRTAELLRRLGHDAVSARELGMKFARDPELVAYAIEHQRIIATLDKDHPQIVATSGRTEPSVILLRHKSPPAELASRLIDQTCAKHHDKLLTGCLITCEDEETRLHTLPIKKS